MVLLTCYLFVAAHDSGTVTARCHYEKVKSDVEAVFGKNIYLTSLMAHSDFLRTRESKSGNMNALEGTSTYWVYRFYADDTHEGVTVAAIYDPIRDTLVTKWDVWPGFKHERLAAAAPWIDSDSASTLWRHFGAQKFFDAHPIPTDVCMALYTADWLFSKDNRGFWLLWLVADADTLECRIDASTGELIKFYRSDPS
jgi:hypothetical protein